MVNGLLDFNLLFCYDQWFTSGIYDSSDRHERKGSILPSSHIYFFYVLKVFTSLLIKVEVKGSIRGVF